jgi:hypothetical protein
VRSTSSGACRETANQHFRLLSFDHSYAKPRVPERRQRDLAVAKALARAYRWKQKLDDGTYETMVDLAKAEGINESYVTRLIRLNLLAPDIVEAALDGRTQLTVQELTEPISPVWSEQRTELARKTAA